ncbi:MAG: prepilin-type N-terminal cleavage/methylation domain-containing protein [Dissulfuribacterales bacterium]
MIGRNLSKTGDSGYTLIEVLIALAIFSIGFMAVGALQSKSLMQTGEAAHKTEAWAILEDQVEVLKAVPFYANDNGVNDDGDGATDEADELFKDDDGNFPLAAGAHNEPRLQNRYTVHWQVVDDQPVAQVTMPPPAAGDPILPDVPAGSYTVSKTITVAVTRQGGDPQTDALATAEFVKVWAADPDGIP